MFGRNGYTEQEKNIKNTCTHNDIATEVGSKTNSKIVIYFKHNFHETLQLSFNFQ
jgi:hypothetical protein